MIYSEEKKKKKKLSYSFEIFKAAVSGGVVVPSNPGSQPLSMRSSRIHRSLRGRVLIVSHSVSNRSPS
jgi:hypothetical protein